MSGIPTLKTIGSVSTKAVVNARFLQIGTEKFLPSEHPARIRFPSEMRVAVHDLIGGSRVTQPMGLVLGDVTWEGDLFGPQVEKRATALERMEAAGAEVTLRWAYRRLGAIVKSFEAEYQHANWVRYAITVSVTRDLVGRYLPPPSLGVADQTASVAANAAQNALSIPTDADGTALTSQTLATIASLPKPLGQGTGNSQTFLQQIGANIKSAEAYATKLAGYVEKGVSQVQGYVNTARSQVDAVTAVESQFGQTVSQAEGVVNSVRYTASHVIQAAQLAYNLRIVQRNVQYGSAVGSVVVRSPTSYEEIASRFYGDRSLAGQLRRANGAVSNVVRAGTTISVFPLQKTSVQSTLTAVRGT